MAVTKGHGNPKWTRDEVILALDLYFEFNGQVPGPSHEKVIELSDLLRSFPFHQREARKKSFRNPGGVAFKLQNLRQVATGKGLGNTSKMDRAVWDKLGSDPQETRRLASLIRAGVQIVDHLESEQIEDTFIEGRLVTETHLRRERDSTLRERFLQIRQKERKLQCDLCEVSGSSVKENFRLSLFECHHIKPLSASGERTTEISDLALLCANRHRLIHRAIAQEGRWLSIEQAALILFCDPPGR